MDRVIYCARPLRMYSPNVTLRALGGAGGSRKDASVPPTVGDNYLTYPTLVVPDWARRTTNAAKAGTTVTITFADNHGLSDGDIIVLDGFDGSNADTGYQDANGLVVANDSNTGNEYAALFGDVIEVKYDPTVNPPNQITFRRSVNIADFNQPYVFRADRPAIVVEAPGAKIEGIALVRFGVPVIDPLASDAKRQLLSYQAGFKGIGIVGRLPTTDTTIRDVTCIGLRRAVDLNNAPGVRIDTLYGDVENGIRLTNCADSCEAREVRLFSYVSQAGVIPTGSQPLAKTGAAVDAGGRLKLLLQGPHGLTTGERLALSGVNFLPPGAALYRYTVEAPAGEPNNLILTEVAWDSTYDYVDDDKGDAAFGGGDSTALSPLPLPFFDASTTDYANRLGITVANQTSLKELEIGDFVNVQIQGSLKLGGFYRVLNVTKSAGNLVSLVVDLPYSADYLYAHRPSVEIFAPGGTTRGKSVLAGGPTTQSFANSGGSLKVKTDRVFNLAAQNDLITVTVPGQPALTASGTISQRISSKEFVTSIPYSNDYIVRAYATTGEVNIAPAVRDGIGIQTGDVDGGYWNTAVKGQRTLYDLDSSTMTWMSRRGEQGAPGEKGINLLNSTCVRLGKQADRFNSFGANNKSSASGVSLQGENTRPRFWGEQITDDGIASVDLNRGGVELWGCTKKGAGRIRLGQGGGPAVQWSALYGGDFTKADLVGTDADLRKVNLLGTIADAGINGATSGMESAGAYQHFVRGTGAWLSAFRIEQPTGRVAMNQGFVGFPLKRRTTAGAPVRLTSDGSATVNAGTIGPIVTANVPVGLVDLVVVGTCVVAGGGLVVGDLVVWELRSLVLRAGNGSVVGGGTPAANATDALRIIGTWSTATLTITADTTTSSTSVAGSLHVAVKGLVGATIDWSADLRARPLTL